MPKKKTAKSSRTKRVLKWHKSDSWFFEHHAPDLPFWIFLVLGIVFLVLFGLWIKNPKEATVEKLVVPSLPVISTNPEPVPAGNPTLAKTVTLNSASDPSLVSNLGKIYVTFRNNTGGYSVAVYDENLTELEAPRWITNGSSVPNQIQARPILVASNWYLAYIGGDGFVRLSKFDLDFNRQREFTFAQAVSLAGNPTLSVFSGYDATNHITITVNDGAVKTYVASPDLGDINNLGFAYKASDTGAQLGGTTGLITSTKHFQAEESGSSVTIKLLSSNK